LTDQPSAFSEKKYGKWRVLGFQVLKGKSLLLLQKQKPALEAADSGATPEYMYFESAAPLRRMMKDDGKIYLVGEDISLPLDADLYFYPSVSGGSDGTGYAFGRWESGKTPSGLLLKDFSGWKGAFRLFQIESRETDAQGNEVFTLKSTERKAGSAAVRFRVEAGDESLAYASWQSGDYLYFIAEGPKGLAARPKSAAPTESFSEIYAKWRDPRTAEVKRSIAQRIFAGNLAAVPSNSRVPKPTVLRETGGREFLLKTRRLTEAEADVSYSAILLSGEMTPGGAYRQAAEIRLSFGIFESAEDYRYLKEHGVPRRSFTFIASPDEALRLGFEFDAAGHLLSQSQEKNWILKERGKPPVIRGEWQNPEPRADPEIPPLQAEYELFAPSVGPGSVVMLGRGSAPAGFEKQFISIPDPVVRRRHLLLRRRAGGEVEIQGIPPAEASLDRGSRQAFWVEMAGAWLPLPADLPFQLQPGQRFALGRVLRPPLGASQALVFRLSEDGNSLLLD
jgi:hypothetical protein